MEYTVRVTFSRITDMQRAVEALKKQGGVIDVRLDGSTGSTLPDDVEMAIEPLGMGLTDNQENALWVSVQKSRFREAEDTIAACGGTIVSS